MKKFFTLILLSLFLNSYSQQVRISQIYGGGGQPGALYNQDFIEIFNSGTSSIDISGWSIQYASATGSTWVSAVIPGSTILSGGRYFLIGLASGAVGSNLPAPDLAAAFDISPTEGKVALVNNNATLSGTTCSSAAIVDIVGYGANASCYEVAPASTSGMDNTQSCRHRYSGCLNSDNNAFFFSSICFTAKFCVWSDAMQPGSEVMA